MTYSRPSLPLSRIDPRLERSTGPHNAACKRDAFAAEWATALGSRVRSNVTYIAEHSRVNRPLLNMLWCRMFARKEPLLARPVAATAAGAR
jgi:hypothetical protein